MRGGDDAGMTLVELLVATMISGLLATAIAAAFTVGVRTTDTANQRLAGSQGAQLATSYFPTDVESATTVTPGGTPCTGGTPTVATLSWSDLPASGASVAKQAVYTCLSDGSTFNLVRQYSENGVLVSQAVVVRAVTAASLTCAPGCATVRSARLTATEAGGFTFAVSGLRRAQ